MLSTDCSTGNVVWRNLEGVFISQVKMEHFLNSGASCHLSILEKLGAFGKVTVGFGATEDHSVDASCSISSVANHRMF